MTKFSSYEVLAFIFITTFIIIGPSCFLHGAGTGPRPATSWTALSTPGFACPQDDITVTWDVGTVTCPERAGPNCVTFTATDTVGLVSPPFSRMALSGSEVIGQFNTDTTFIFNVTHVSPSDAAWSQRSTDLKVATPTSTLSQQFGFGAVCNPRTNRYDLSRFTLDMTNTSFLNATRGFGNCMRIVDICNIPDSARRNPGGPITILTVGDASLPPTRIRLGECVSSYIGSLNLTTDKYYEAYPESIDLNPDIMSGVCVSEEVTNPADPKPIIDVLFILSCDTEAEGCTM